MADKSGYGIISEARRCLPAKKRIELRYRVSAGEYSCLPAKKRIREAVEQKQGVAEEILPLKKRMAVAQDPATPVLLPFKKRVRAPSAVVSKKDDAVPAARPRPVTVLPRPPTLSLHKKRVWALPPVPLSPIREVDESAVVEERVQTSSYVRLPVAENEVNQEEKKSIVSEESKETDGEEDDGVVCAVCQSTDGEPCNPIVFCDGCDLMVHAQCYGAPLAKSIPEGDWFCHPCAEKSNKKTTQETNCCLCPATGGAVKPTTDGRWAHIVCALLVPEVFFHDPDMRAGIDCSRIPANRWSKSCYICGDIRGCTIECSQPKCRLRFHVSCAMGDGLCIEYQEAKARAVVAGFCTEHTKLWEKQQATGKFRIVARA